MAEAGSASPAARPDWDSKLLRTMLFVPGTSERKLVKARTLHADMVALDLEDTVTPEQRPAARNLIASHLPSVAAESSALAGVRINPVATNLWREDLQAVMSEALDYVIAPKTEHSDQLHELDAVMSELEAQAGLEDGRVRIIASIETALGVVRSGAIALAAPKRLATFAFGPVDLAADIGIDLTEEGLELLHARSQVVIAARAGGRLAAIDGPYLELTNVAGLRATTAQSRRLGFQGRVVIHPAQLDVVGEVFAYLSEKELAEARRIIDVFEGVERDGVASVAVDGLFVDYPVYYRAQRKVMLHDRFQDSTENKGTS
jgi:citrate lyase subunit beta/citryl-CoA lyase